MGERDDLILRGVREDRAREGEAAASRVYCRGRDLGERDVRRPEDDCACVVADIELASTRHALLDEEGITTTKPIRIAGAIGVGIVRARQDPVGAARARIGDDVDTVLGLVGLLVHQHTVIGGNCHTVDDKGDLRPCVGQRGSNARGAVVVGGVQVDRGLDPHRVVVVDARRSNGVHIFLGRRLQRQRRIGGKKHRHRRRDGAVLYLEALSASRLDGHRVGGREADSGIGIARMDDLVRDEQVSVCVEERRLAGSIGDEDVLDANAPAHSGATVARREDGRAG